MANLGSNADQSTDVFSTHKDMLKWLKCISITPNTHNLVGYSVSDCYAPLVCNHNELPKALGLTVSF